MVYERARGWLEGRNIATRDEAENFLSQTGNDPNSTLWATVLDAIYPEAEILTVQASFAMGEQQQKEIKAQENLTFLDRAGRFMRRILRGQA